MSNRDPHIKTKIPELIIQTNESSDRKKKKSSDQQYFGCEICNMHGMPHSAKGVQIHLNSKAHNYMKMFWEKKMWPGPQEKAAEPAPLIPRPQIYTFVDRKGIILCTICNEACLDGVGLYQHQLSEKHKMSLIKNDYLEALPPIYHCEICDKAISGYDYFLHHQQSYSHLEVEKAIKSQDCDEYYSSGECTKANCLNRHFEGAKNSQEICYNWLNTSCKIELCPFRHTSYLPNNPEGLIPQTRENLAKYLFLLPPPPPPAPEEPDEAHQNIDEYEENYVDSQEQKFPESVPTSNIDLDSTFQPFKDLFEQNIVTYPMYIPPLLDSSTDRNAKLSVSDFNKSQQPISSIDYKNLWSEFLSHDFYKPSEIKNKNDSNPAPKLEPQKEQEVKFDEKNVKDILNLVQNPITDNSALNSNVAQSDEALMNFLCKITNEKNDDKSVDVVLEILLQNELQKVIYDPLSHSMNNRYLLIKRVIDMRKERRESQAKLANLLSDFSQANVDNSSVKELNLFAPLLDYLATSHAPPMPNIELGGHIDQQEPNYLTRYEISTGDSVTSKPESQVPLKMATKLAAFCLMNKEDLEKKVEKILDTESEKADFIYDGKDIVEKAQEIALSCLPRNFYNKDFPKRKRPFTRIEITDSTSSPAAKLEKIYDGFKNEGKRKTSSIINVPVNQDEKLSDVSSSSSSSLPDAKDGSQSKSSTTRKRTDSKQGEEFLANVSSSPSFNSESCDTMKKKVKNLDPQLSPVSDDHLSPILSDDDDNCGRNGSQRRNKFKIWCKNGNNQETIKPKYEMGCSANYNSNKKIYINKNRQQKSKYKKGQMNASVQRSTPGNKASITSPGSLIIETPNEYYSNYSTSSNNPNTGKVNNDVNLYYQSYPNSGQVHQMSNTTSDRGPNSCDSLGMPYAYNMVGTSSAMPSFPGHMTTHPISPYSNQFPYASGSNNYSYMSVPPPKPPVFTRLGYFTKKNMLGGQQPVYSMPQYQQHNETAPFGTPKDYNDLKITVKNDWASFNH